MNEMKFKWKAWIDPFGSNAHEFGLEEKDLEDFEDDEPEKKKKKKREFIGKVAATNFGMLPLSEKPLAGSEFDFWTLETNFDLTTDALQTIEKTAGVESIFPLTRYRVRIGFPRSGLFDVDKVKSNVERRLKDADVFSKEAFMLSDVWGCSLELVANIRSMIRDLRENYSVWAMVVLPNGNISVIHNDHLTDEFGDELIKLNYVAKSTGGKIFSFLDDKETAPLV